MKTYEIKLKFSVVAEAPGRRSKCSTPAEVCAYMEGAFENPDVESFWVLFLDRKNQCKGRHMVTLGTATSSLVAPREAFRAAVIHSATAVIFVHNHPSGDPAPSSADILITRKLREAATVLDIQLLDHVVIGDKEHDPAGVGHYSFRSAGLC